LKSLFRQSVYVPYSERVCCFHGEDDSLTVPDGFAASQFFVSLNNEIALCFETIKNMVISERKKALNSQAVRFSSMSDDVLVFETGLNREQFQYLLQFVKDGQLHVRSAEFTLGVYLSRLRVYTYDKLALRWIHITRQTASSNCEEIRQVLSKLFCNKYLSLNSDRYQLISYQIKVAKQLHAPSGDHIILVLDDTYIFIQKRQFFFSTRNVFRSQEAKSD